MPVALNMPFQTMFPLFGENQQALLREALAAAQVPSIVQCCLTVFVVHSLSDHPFLLKPQRKVAHLPVRIKIE